MILFGTGRIREGFDCEHLVQYMEQVENFMKLVSIDTENKEISAQREKEKMLENCVELEMKGLNISKLSVNFEVNG